MPASSRSTCSAWACSRRSRSASTRSSACAARRSTSRASRSTTRRSTGRSRRRTPSASSRSRAARRCRASSAPARRTSTTSPSRSRSCVRGRSRGRRCIRTSSAASASGRTRTTQSLYDHPLLAECLEDTLGAIIFQEQVLDVAMALAGFSVGEAEGLRRAMSRKRSHDAIEAYRERFYEGAASNGVDRGDRRTRLHEDQRLRLVRLPEVACGRLRAPRLPVGLAAPPLSGRVSLRAPERPADGLLSARQPRS